MPALLSPLMSYSLIRSHYPERLGLALIINVPFLVMAFLNLIFPFVDPVTREKVKFNPKVVEQGIMTPDQVMSEWDGSVDFKYEHEEYWEELVELCETRRTAWLQRWRSLGGTVGISEWDYKQKGDVNETPQLGEPAVNGDL
jgi:phosphatidylinositol/phosphatidylcholine transfer protein